MTITVRQRKRSKPEFYIYYNDWTGEIISVSTSSLSNSFAPCIVTEDPNAQKIIAGEINEQNFVISSDRYGEQKLMRKNEFLQLRKQEDDLFLLPEKKNADWNIRARLFLKNNRLVFEANKTMLSRLVAYSIGKEIKLNVRATFDFYLIKRDRPDALVDVYSIDAESLINYGYVVIDIKHVLMHSAISDLQLLTRRYFENYYFEIVNDAYVEPEEASDQNEKALSWRTAKTDGDAHLSFVQRGKYITVTSKVKAEQLDDLGLHNLTMNFYVVGETPDQYHGTFDVDISRVRMGQEEKFEVDFDIDEVNLMYRNPYLKVDKRKIE